MIAAPAVRLAEALTAMMPGFGAMTIDRFKPNDRRDLIEKLYEQSGIGDRINAKEKLS